MARTKSTPRPSDPSPREEGREQNNTPGEPPNELNEPVKSGASPAMKAGASSTNKTDSTSEGRTHRGSGATAHHEQSSKKPSAPTSRAHHSGSSRQDRQSHHEYRSRTSSRVERDYRGRGDDRSGQRHHEYGRRDRIREQDHYGNHRRNNEWRGGSDRGWDSRSRGYSRDHRYRSENSHRGYYHGQDYSRRYEDYNPSPDYGRAPSRNEFRTHRGRSPDYEHPSQAPTRDGFQTQREGRTEYKHQAKAPIRDNYETHNERRTENDSASAQNEHQSRLRTNQPPPAPSLAPSQKELSDTEKLKKQLEQEELETRIAQKRLERERINQQLIQMKMNDAVQSENIAAASEVDLLSENVAASSEDAVLSENVAASSELVADTHRFMDDDSDGDVVQVRRKSPNEKGNKRAVKPPSALQKNKTKRRRTGGKAKLAASTKRKLCEAQKVKNEKMKHQLLKEYEENLAERKAEKMHYYTEKDLMSSFTPEIIDHYLMPGGDGKFLVEWVESARGKMTGYDDCNHYTSWISHEDFLFPALARGYLSRKINSNTSDKETEGLKLWVEDCEERERCLNCLNTFDADGNEHESHMEIDFCCFLCKCSWDHPLKHTIRNCEGGLKYHRGCCHQYEDSHDFESTFISPVGKVVLEQFEEHEEEDKADEEREIESNDMRNPEAQVEKFTVSSMEIVDGVCEKYARRIQGRSKRDAVVLCINAGVGTATVTLKHLRVKVAKVIHVEMDRVAQHVIRSNHDYCYGESDDDDQIEHIIGLYNEIGDVSEDPEKLVRKYGPIDMIICNTPQGKSREESASYANDFFEIVKDIERSNKDIYHFDNLFYLLESPTSIKDSLPLEGLSYCLCEPRKLFVCNWPISSEKASLLRLKTEGESLGLPNGYVLRSVGKLYASLLKALCVGLEDSKWRDKIHSKYWPFLSMGPSGYDVKLKKGEFGPESFLLRLRNPQDSTFLSDVNYSTHLLGRSSSIKILPFLLEPMKKLFNEKNYGSPFNAMESHEQGQFPESASTSTHEHGHMIYCPNSEENDVACDAAHDLAVVKTEVKGEDPSTDDEAHLFDEVERSFAR